MEIRLVLHGKGEPASPQVLDKALVSVKQGFQFGFDGSGAEQGAKPPSTTHLHLARPGPVPGYPAYILFAGDWQESDRGLQLSSVEAFPIKYTHERFIWRSLRGKVPRKDLLTGTTITDSDE